MGEFNTVAVLDSVSPDLQAEIVKRKLPPYGWSGQRISAWLEKEHAVKISHVSINKWLKRNESAVSQSIYGSKEFMGRAQEMYGEVLAEYFVCLKYMIQLEKTVCTTNKLDLVAQVKLGGDLFDKIKEGTLAAKDLVVGVGGAQSHVINLEDDIRELQQMPVLQILASDNQKEE